MMRLPWWLQWLVDLFVYAASRTARDAGAAEERSRSRAEAERQERVAKDAGDAAAEGEDDPRDLRKD